MIFEPLRRCRSHRTRDKGGTYRWYNDYRLPDPLGGGTVTVRLHGNAEDRSGHVNRTENVRPIPPSDPDFPRLYARRNDAESINRGLEDTLFLGRAHSLRRLASRSIFHRLRDVETDVDYGTIDEALAAWGCIPALARHRLPPQHRLTSGEQIDLVAVPMNARLR